jgi:neutral ceramidase
MKALFAALCAVLMVAGASAAPAKVFKAGAAKVDITPAADKLPKGVLGVNDHIFVRAIVVDNGTSKAALITADVGIISPQAWKTVTARAEKELRIPADNILLTATHTHSAMMGPDFADQVMAAVHEAVKRAEPAVMAYGTGVSYINVNRNIIDPITHGWWEGPNYDGPSDKTVAVVRFATPAGKPIGVYYNYGVHGVITGQLDQISGDIQGTTSDYIEDSLGGDAVAVYSNGAAGDQDPIFFQQTYDLRDIRIKDYAKRGQDISNSMPPGGQGLDRSNPQVAKLMNQQRRMAQSMGQMLGEEVLHVMRANLERPTTSTAIAGASVSATCPGRNQTNMGRAGYAGTYVDGAPVSLHLSAVRLGDVYIGGVDGEVFTMIAQRLKRESPFKHTMMTTLTNGVALSSDGKGPAGYIPNDAAYGYQTFEVLSTHLKPGCAETAIVDGLLDLMQNVSKR